MEFRSIPKTCIPGFHRTGRDRSPLAHTQCGHSWCSCWWACASARDTHTSVDLGVSQTACPVLLCCTDWQTCFSFWLRSCLRSLEPEKTYRCKGRSRSSWRKWRERDCGNGASHTELTLIRSMGVLTASGSGSTWLTATTSCLLRPFRLDFFWTLVVKSCWSI